MTDIDKLLATEIIKVLNEAAGLKGSDKLDSEDFIEFIKMSEEIK